MSGTGAQEAKSVVRAFQSAVDAAAPGEAMRAACAASLSPGHAYRGVHPFGDLRGPGAVAETVLSPLRRAAPVLQRRPDIFLAGVNHRHADGAAWVVAMGNFLGDFTGSWLGIPPTGKATYLPYASLYRVEEGAIAETVEFLDPLAVITQAGLNPFAGAQTGASLMPPGPLTHDGLLHGPQDAAESERSRILTERMLTELADGYTSPADHMARNWHADMTWFGPSGIGTSIGFAGYRRGHTDPFNDRQDITDILDWELSVAEGAYSAVMWWPCLRMRNTGGYLGLPPNPAIAEMRVVDLYRRDGGKLAENWIFIDILHFMAQQGVDLLSDIGARP